MGPSCFPVLLFLSLVELKIRFDSSDTAFLKVDVKDFIRSIVFIPHPNIRKDWVAYIVEITS